MTESIAMETLADKFDATPFEESRVETKGERKGMVKTCDSILDLLKIEG